MATEKQIEANRRNAQKSTGPKSEDGKSRSSQNARTHCLTTADLYVAPGEEALFEETLENFRNELQPSGEIEAKLFDDLFHAHWSLRNARRADAQTPRDHTAELDRLSRYQVRFERSFHKAQKELSRLQTERVYLSTFDDAEEAAAGPLVSWREIRKRRIGERKAAAQAEDREITNYLNTTPLTRTSNAADSLRLPQLKNEPVCPDVNNPFFTPLPPPKPKNEPISTPNPQIPRSAPCPCGSGQKYKRCCGKDAPPVLFHQSAA